jgi:uncharacterized protein (DUF2141 family)
VAGRLSRSPRRAPAWTSAALLLVALAGCATPVAPTGGPADTTPPSLVVSNPADGATNVTERTLTLTFSERLATNAASAVTITPPTGTPPEVSVNARELRVTLPELRDSTTYVVTVGTALADQRNVALQAPITVAFATGDEIDRGRIAGTVRSPDTGSAAGGLAVWAYALDDSLGTVDPTSVAPDYRTETGADGAFTLEYLRPGPFFVVAVEDRNRNARVDAGERFAAPPAPSLSARADSTVPEPATFFVTALDTVPPVAQRLRPISDRRLALRFSEPVRLIDAAAFAEAVTVADSASGAPQEVSWYQPPASAFELYAEATRALPPAPLLVTSGGTDAVADSAGLGVAAFRLSAALPARADTVTARFDAFVPSAPDSVVLPGGVRPGVRFTSPPGALLDGVEVRSGGQPLDVPFVPRDGVTFVPDTSVSLPRRVTITAPVGDSTASQTYVLPDSRNLGGIVGRVEADGPVRVEVRPEAGAPVIVAADTSGAFVADGLLPGAYTLRLWLDRDGDGRWTGGQLQPYAPPEPLVFLPQPVQVRARWETEIDPVTL